MKTPNTDTVIRGRIESFLSEISTLVRRAAIESVEQALGAGPARRGRGRKRAAAAPSNSAARRGGKRGKRTSAEVNQMGQRVLTYVKKNDGQRLEEIGKGLGLPTKDLKLPVSKLLMAKQLKTKGQRRGTKYFVR